MATFTRSGRAEESITYSAQLRIRQVMEVSLDESIGSLFIRLDLEDSELDLGDVEKETWFQAEFDGTEECCRDQQYW